MESHPIDPIALVSGLLFGLAGLAIFAKSQWDDVDVTAFTGAGVMVVAVLLAGLVIVRYVQDGREPDVVNVITTDQPVDDDVAEPTIEIDTED
ncbi:MAG: hypothetical protein AAF548_06790 [Actinomycetota bacterium]